MCHRLGFPASCRHCFGFTSFSLWVQIPSVYFIFYSPSTLAHTRVNTLKVSFLFERFPHVFEISIINKCLNSLRASGCVSLSLCSFLFVGICVYMAHDIVPTWSMLSSQCRSWGYRRHKRYNEPRFLRCVTEIYTTDECFLHAGKQRIATFHPQSEGKFGRLDEGQSLHRKSILISILTFILFKSE